MRSDANELVFTLFNRALELGPADRKDFLDSNCDDTVVRREVESLLDSHLRAGSFLEPVRRAGGAAHHDGRNGRPADPLTGDLVNGRYQIERILGSGGQGVAYLAHDRSVGNRLVVVKMLFGALPDADPIRSTLRREVEILAEINHPGVVGILDAGEWKGKPYLTIEYVEGETLRELLAKGIDRAAAASLLRQIGSAMAAVHAKGIAHRDLKPENVLIAKSDGRVRLIDFGIARRPRSETATGTTTFFVAGTLNYMAPEQFFSDHTLSSDVYALGVIAYEMLTGRLPFADDDGSRRFSRKPALSPASDARISRRALRLLGHCLSSDPSLRPSSIQQISEQLANEVESGWRRERNRRIAAIGCLLLIIALVTSAGVLRNRLWGATYERVVEVPRGYDPTTFHFGELNEIRGQIVFNADNSGYEGFREFTNTQGFLVHPLTTVQQRAALSKGWILSGTIRAEQGGAFLIADFDRVNRRYDVFVFRNPNGGTTVRLIDKLIPSLLGREINLPDSSPEFHDYKLQFDPRSGMANLAVDGQVVLSGYKGHSEYVNSYGMVLGVTKYLSERGVSTFGASRFEILP